MVKLTRPPEFVDARQLPSQKMLAAIGRMAVVSASIEDILHGLHWKVSDLSVDVGPVITRDARATRLSEDILNIAKAAKISPAIIEDLADIFADFRAAVTTRNQCLHWIWESSKKRRHQVSPPSYKPGQKPIHFTVSEIEALADQLVWIETRLSAHECTEEQLTEEKKMYGDKAHIYVPTPWLDTLPPQESEPELPLDSQSS